MKRLGLCLGLMIPTVLFSPADPTPVWADETASVKGKFRGVVNPIPLSDTESLWQLDCTGTGRVSHLGRIVATFSFPEVEFDLANMQVIVKVPKWIGTFTAANGDQIIGSYAITESVLPISPLGNIAFRADLVVLRGTGQFAHATGQAVAVATANVFTKTFTVEFAGRLTTIP